MCLFVWCQVGDQWAMPISQAMPTTHLTQTRATLPMLLIAGALSVLLALLIPAVSRADVKTFGSPLFVAATLDTAEDLSYRGTDTAVPPPTGNVHTYHYGADMAVWNATLASGAPRSPDTGQALKIALEGCAVPAAGGPPPLTQIHFQDITPSADGGAKINIT